MKNFQKVLLTGANGFVGRALSVLLLKEGSTVRFAMRGNSRNTNGQMLSGDDNNNKYYFESLDGKTEWDEALDDIEVVVHLAARAHVLKETLDDPYSEFLKVNFEGTRRIAEQAAEKGVKRFIYISSIGVNGKSTGVNPYTEKNKETPHNHYSMSKFLAEQALRQIELETSMEVVIIRPPLVYGPHVKANFLRLINLVDKGLPLPFAGINNLRSFVAIENLVDAIVLCMNHSGAGGETYIISDGEDVSTAELIRRIANNFGKSAKLFPFPPSVIKTLLKITGKENIYEGLWNSLIVDSGKIRKQLGWKPPVSVDEGIRNTVEWYLNERN